MPTLPTLPWQLHTMWAWRRRYRLSSLTVRVVGLGVALAAVGWRVGGVRRALCSLWARLAGALPRLVPSKAKAAQARERTDRKWAKRKARQAAKERERSRHVRAALRVESFGGGVAAQSRQLATPMPPLLAPTQHLRSSTQS